MSASRNIIVTLILLFVAISLAPSAVAGVDISETDWTKMFDEGTDDYGDGTNGDLEKSYVNVTDNKVRLRANITDGSNDGLDDNALQIYIDSDTDEETGLTSETVSGGDWAQFYDGLGTLGADYRVSVRDGGVPIIQEHEEDASFDTIDSVEMEENGKSVALEIDRETIGDPDEFDLKFAYIADPGTSSIDSNDFVWAPEDPVRTSGNSIGEIETAEVDAAVQFGDEEVDDDATVVFDLINDGETVDTIPNSTYNDNGELTETFEVNVDNFDGDVDLAVDVENDDSYSTDRESINNTVGITTGGLTEDDTEEGRVALSIIEAEVNFGTEDPDDDATVDFSLTDNDGTEVANPVVEDVTKQTTQSFTVNPNDFNDQGELSVDVTNDDDYPFEGTKSVDSISEGSSLSSVNSNIINFDATTIGHEFTLDPDRDTQVNIDDNEGFTINATLNSSSTEGSNVTLARHIINFDSDNLNESDINVDFNSTLNNDQYIINEDKDDEVEIAEEEGQYGIEIQAADLNNPVIEEGERQHLYEIEFNFSDGLQGELDEGQDVFEFTPTTADGSEIFNQTDGEDELAYTSSREEDVNIENTETRITDAEITLLTEYGNMEDVQTKFAVDVETNEGNLSRIELNDTNGDALPQHEEDDNHVIECSESSCESLSGQLSYTPLKDNVTATVGSGEYNSDFEFNITAEDGEGNEINLDNYLVKIYYFGDVSPETAPDKVQTEDVRTVIQSRGEGDGNLPWDDEDLARTDMNNDGEITVSDITRIVEEYNP